MKKKDKKPEPLLSDEDMKGLMELFRSLQYGLTELPQHILVVNVYNKLNKYFADKDKE